MSGPGKRRFHQVVVEPSAQALLSAAAQGGSRNTSDHGDVHPSPQPLPSYVALNFNFKPDSTHDCKKGALFQPGSSRNSNADWQLELDSNDVKNEAGPSSMADAEGTSKKVSAHIFTGPQTAAKAYDLVLVWDETARVYRLDRIASTFALKFERSKTVLSSQSQDVWEGKAVKPKKRALEESAPLRPADSAGPSYDARAPGQGALKLRSKPSSAASASTVRRSSRRSLAVEMEEFEDPSGSLGDDRKDVSASRVKRSSPASETGILSKEESKRVKSSASTKDRRPSDESVGELRRSRRRSSQAQAEEASREPVQPDTDVATPSTANAPDGMDADDDGLALELELELERELEVEKNDPSEAEEEEARPAAYSSNTKPKLTSTRTLSPVSRLKRAERESKIDTPKAHTPDLDEASTHDSNSLMRSFRRSPSSFSNRSTPMDIDNHGAPASIGLGLQQTGVGITPTSSPQLGDASLRQPSKAVLSKPDDEEEEDDDLQDFAAELDMSLAEGPDSQTPARVDSSTTTEKRRSSRAYTTAQAGPDARSRQARKAYGLGGPRQEEEELEDSD